MTNFNPVLMVDSHGFFANLAPKPAAIFMALHSRRPDYLSTQELGIWASQNKKEDVISSFHGHINKLTGLLPHLVDRKRGKGAAWRLAPYYPYRLCQKEGSGWGEWDTFDTLDPGYGEQPREGGTSDLVLRVDGLRVDLNGLLAQAANIFLGDRDRFWAAQDVAVELYGSFESTARVYGIVEKLRLKSRGLLQTGGYGKGWRINPGGGVRVSYRKPA